MKIIDPFTLVSYDINTPKGKHVLLNYVKNYQSGGSWTGELEDSLEDSDGIDIGVEDTGFSSDGEAAGGGGGAAAKEVILTDSYIALKTISNLFPEEDKCMSDSLFRIISGDNSDQFLTIDRLGEGSYGLVHKIELNSSLFKIVRKFKETYTENRFAIKEMESIRGYIDPQYIGNTGVNTSTIEESVKIRSEDHKTIFEKENK